MQNSWTIMLCYVFAWFLLILFQPLFKGGKSFPPNSPSKTESNNLMVVGQSSQHLQPNFLSTQQKIVSSPSPDFSVSPSSSSTSNNSNLPQQSQSITIRNDAVTPNPTDIYQGLSSSLQTKQIRAPSRQSRWKSQQNLSRVGNPYPTNNQNPNQLFQNMLPTCQQLINPNQLLMSFHNIKRNYICAQCTIIFSKVSDICQLN